MPPAESAPRPLDLPALRYPAPYHPDPPLFPVDYEMPARASRERFLQIAFARSPTEAELSTNNGGLDLWAPLPPARRLRGFDGMAPWHSIAVADPAFLLDPETVELAFPDIFLCDDDGYAAVIDWAHVLHGSVCPVAGVLLR